MHLLRGNHGLFRIGKTFGLAPFDPEALLQAQYFLDGGASYQETNLSNIPHLRSLESYGTYRAPRQGRQYVFDGVDDKLVGASVTGTTIVEKVGTATLTIGTGEITASAGTLSYLELSNGSIYQCLEEDGTNCYDASGNANHLTITNATLETFHAATTSLTSNPNNELGYRLSGSVYIPAINSTTAADGNALTETGKSPYPARTLSPVITLDGVDDFVSAVNPFDNDSGAYSISAKIYATSISTFNTAFGAGVIKSTNSTPQIGDFMFTVDSLGAVSFFNWRTTGTDALGRHKTANGVIVEDTWHHVVLTFDGTSTNKCYIDAVEVAFGSPLSTSSGWGTGYEVGRSFNGSGYFWNGSLSDIRVYHKALSSDEVTYLYSNGISGTNPTTTNLEAYYTMQEGGGTIIYDLSGNANHGTLTNATLVDAWANTTDVVKDHCVEYGGLVSSGVFVPGNLTGSNAANGSPKTLSSGKFGNPHSLLNMNPFTAAELNGLGVETSYEVTDARQSVSPADTKFRRTASDGDDRFLTFTEAQTGDDLTNLEDYVS